MGPAAADTERAQSRHRADIERAQSGHRADTERTQSARAFHRRHVDVAEFVGEEEVLAVGGECHGAHLLGLPAAPAAENG